MFRFKICTFDTGLLAPHGTQSPLGADSVQQEELPQTMTRWFKLRRGVMSLVSLLSLSACSIHGMTGDVMSDYTVKHLSPYVLGTSDLTMACEMGSSMGPFLLSFERVTDQPDMAAIPTFMTAALCAEQVVWEAALRAIRAENAGEAAAYKDALVAQKRAHGVVAHRYYSAYQRMNRLFGERCADLENEDQQLVMLLGLMGGLLAVQNDRASGVMVDVPVDVPRRVARQVKCLDNERWWGMPQALETAVWAGVPNSAPSEIPADQLQSEIYKRMEANAQIGRRAGVRLVDSVYAFTALSLGDEERVKQVITDFARSRKEVKPNPKWRLFDETSAAQLLFISDQLWTQTKGHRTQQDLGVFWSEDSGEDTGENAEDEDSLLDALDEE